ncbi:Rho guanine nucleotide exchange factor 28, partial [Struthio camelus australis]
GQVTINATFGKDIYLPEDAEFYFVYNGSVKRHVMFAERISDNALQSVVPGHGCQEAVSVSVLMYTKGYSPVVLGSCPVTYRENLSCKLSRFLVNHAKCVTATSHKMLLDKFELRMKDLQSLDNDLMMAIAHEELPSTWNILGNYSEGEPEHKETLLHLVMKLGLVKLSQFLVAQPGGSLALALPNEDGATPLDLALQNGHSRLVEVFTNFQGSHSFDISRAELSEGACLRFVHSSGTLTLTFNHTAEHFLESDIKLFRKYFWDRPLLYKVVLTCNTCSLLGGPKVKVNKPLKHNAIRSSEVLSAKGCCRKYVACCEMQSNQSKQRHSTLDVLKKFKTLPTFFAAARLSAMLNGSDEVYANCMVVNQAGDVKANYIHGDGVSSETCLNPTSSTSMAKSSSSPSLEENDQYIYDPNEGNQMSVKNGENVGLRHRADSYLPVKTHGFIKERGQLHADMKKRSSSLDDLEVDSGSESVSDRSYVHYPPLSSSEATASSRDGLDSSETSADFNISRAESLSLSTGLQPKECLLSGIRSRSYSCSSPKGLLGRPCIPRDFAVGDPNEGQCHLCSGFASALPPPMF